MYTTTSSRSERPSASVSTTNGLVPSSASRTSPKPSLSASGSGAGATGSAGVAPAASSAVGASISGSSSDGSSTGNSSDTASETSGNPSGWGTREESTKKEITPAATTTKKITKTIMNVLNPELRLPSSSPISKSSGGGLFGSKAAGLRAGAAIDALAVGATG